VATLIGAIRARKGKKSRGFQIGFEFRSVNSTPARSLREDGDALTCGPRPSARQRERRARPQWPQLGRPTHESDEEGSSSANPGGPKQRKGKAGGSRPRGLLGHQAEREQGKVYYLFFPKPFPK
jgi:hypothetical protein